MFNPNSPSFDPIAQGNFCTKQSIEKANFCVGLQDLSRSSSSLLPKRKNPYFQKLECKDILPIGFGRAFSESSTSQQKYSSFFVIEEKCIPIDVSIIENVSL